MKYLVAVWLLSLSEWTHQKNVKIAIIGGGISGTSTAYFLRKLFEDSAKIHVYEGKTLGGRLATATMPNKLKYESGGEVIHERNHYMSYFTNKFGLGTRKKAFENVRLGLYNGTNFDYVGRDNHFMNLLSLLYRYGHGVKRIKFFVDEFFDMFSKIYDAQIEGETYNTTYEMILAMDPSFKLYMNQSVYDLYMSYEMISWRYIVELVQASCTANYGQHIMNTHMFAGTISMSIIYGPLWAVKGGNVKVVENLLKHSKARLIREFVSEIEYGPNMCTVTTMYGKSEDYDYVVFAAPLSKNQRIPILFKNMPAKINKFGRYRRIVSTVVSGKLRESKFNGIANRSTVVSIVSDNEHDYIYSINNVRAVDETPDSDVWKVMSAKPLTRAQINQMFERVRDVKTYDWLAYPEYVTPTPSQSFQLANRIYHVNAIEWVASTMEMSCIGAKNVALLLKKHYDAEEEKEETKIQFFGKRANHEK